MPLTWFLYSNDVTSGPFDTEEVRSKLHSGQLGASSYVWRKGQREWMPIQEWEDQLEKLLEAENERSRKPVWYIDLGTSPIGPLTQSELVENLRGIPDLGHARLWSVGMPKWTSLFALHDIVEMVGLTRRESQRAPLMGSVAVNRSSDDPRGYVLKAASISVGGIGVSGSHDLRKGDEVSLLIKSPDLPKTIHLRGEVAYVTRNGFCGIRFLQVPAETHSILFDFTRKFNPPASGSETAA
jgi:hypothetical protein